MIELKLIIYNRYDLDGKCDLIYESHCPCTGKLNRHVIISNQDANKEKIDE